MRMNKEFQLRIFSEELTPEQAAQERRAFEAAEFLRKNGYRANATKYIVTHPKDRAAGIVID